MFRRMSRCLWIVACLIGLGFQGIKLCLIYFNYDISTMVSVGFPDTFQLPGMSLCFYTTNIIRWEKVSPDVIRSMRFENLTKNETLARVKDLTLTDLSLADDKLFANMTVDEQFKNTFDWQEMFKLCTIVDPVSYVKDYKPCDTIFKIVSYLVLNQKCFAFTIKSKTDYKYVSIQRVKGSIGYLNGVIFHSNLTQHLSQMSVIYHEPNGLLREGFTRYLYLTDVSRLFSMSYEKYYNQLLPPPFVTECRNYAHTGFQHQGHCISECIIKRSTENSSELQPGPSIFDRIKYGRLKMVPLVKTEREQHYSRLVQDIESYCDQKCWQPDCEENLLIPTLMAANEYLYGVVVTYAQQAPTIRTIFTQRMTFIEFATDLLSAFGFWLGMNAINVFDFCWKMARCPGDIRSRTLPSNWQSLVANKLTQNHKNLVQRVMQMETRLHLLSTQIYDQQLDKFIGRYRWQHITYAKT